MKGFKPYADEEAVLSIGELSVENRVDRVSVHGGLDITRDREGLRRARILKELLDDVVATLSAEELPEKIAVVPTRKAPNPFGRR